jgi:UDP-N-acetylmuramoylalanine-D-glutamate ligase
VSQAFDSIGPDQNAKTTMTEFNSAEYAFRRAEQHASDHFILGQIDFTEYALRLDKEWLQSVKEQGMPRQMRAAAIACIRWRLRNRELLAVLREFHSQPHRLKARLMGCTVQ